eukprot:6172413-Pleurochrysis_carterae.AAC.2
MSRFHVQQTSLEDQRPAHEVRPMLIPLSVEFPWSSNEGLNFVRAPIASRACMGEQHSRQAAACLGCILLAS